LQGIAGGMLENSGLTQEPFRGAERGRAFGILGAPIGRATAGRVVGGLIWSAFSGRADAGPRAIGPAQHPRPSLVG
jgi:hypothetical protein